jgi:hypothetical protein
MDHQVSAHSTKAVWNRCRHCGKLSPAPFRPPPPVVPHLPLFGATSAIHGTCILES